MVDRIDVSRLAFMTSDNAFVFLLQLNAADSNVSSLLRVRWMQRIHRMDATRQDTDGVTRENLVRGELLRIAS